MHIKNGESRILTGMRVSLRSYPSTIQRHSHPHLQLIVPIMGKLKLETDQVRIVLNEGHLGVVSPHSRHAFSALNANLFMTVDVSATSAERGVPEAFENGLAVRSLSARLRALAEFVRNCDAATTMSPEVCEGLLRLVSLDLGMSNVGKQPLRPHALQRALDFLSCNFRLPITRADAAEAARVSEATLSRLFHRHLASTFGNYLAALRLEHAKQQLLDTNLPVSEIALDCGYSEQSALNRAMRREMGLTPMSFRSKANVRSSASATLKIDPGRQTFARDGQYACRCNGKDVS